MRNEYQPRSGGLSQLNEPPFSPRKLKMMRTYPDMIMAYQMFVMIAENYTNCISDNVRRSFSQKLKEGTILGTAPVGHIQEKCLWSLKSFLVHQNSLEKNIPSNKIYQGI